MEQNRYDNAVESLCYAFKKAAEILDKYPECIVQGADKESVVQKLYKDALEIARQRDLKSWMARAFLYDKDAVLAAVSTYDAIIKMNSPDEGTSIRVAQLVIHILNDLNNSIKNDPSFRLN